MPEADIQKKTKSPGIKKGLHNHSSIFSPVFQKQTFVLFSFENAVPLLISYIFCLSYDTMSASKNKVIAKDFFFLYNNVMI